jgi:hypothetical protein
MWLGWINKLLLRVQFWLVNQGIVRTYTVDRALFILCKGKLYIHQTLGYVHRWAKGKTDEHRAIHTYMRINRYRARQRSVEPSAHRATKLYPDPYPPRLLYALCLHCPMSVLTFDQLVNYPLYNLPLFIWVLEDTFLWKALLHSPVSIPHPFTNFKRLLYTLFWCKLGYHICSVY